jgi:hypothetical protein
MLQGTSSLPEQVNNVVALLFLFSNPLGVKFLFLQVGGRSEREVQYIFGD